MTKVAVILMVSRSTIYRRMKEENRVLKSYTSITDAGLIKRSHPNDGEVMVAGHLSRLGVHVTRARMRASIHRIDPLGVAERSRQSRGYIVHLVGSGLQKQFPLWDTVSEGRPKGPPQ